MFRIMDAALTVRTAGGFPRFMQPVAQGSRVAVCLLRIRSGW